MLHRIIAKIWVLGLVLLFTPLLGFAASEYSLQVPNTINLNESFQVSWTAAEGDNLNRDWIGVFRAGSNNQQYLDWEYTNGQRSGSASLTITNPGTYEIRYLKAGGYVTVATSQTFTVGNTTGGGNNGGGTNSDYSVTVPNTVALNQGFTVNFNAPAGDNLNRDWIGVFRAGSNNQQYLDWEYTNARGSGSVTLTIKDAGTYEIRYLKNGGYTAVETSEQFVVGTATGGGGNNGGENNADYSLSIPSNVSVSQPFIISFTAPAGDNLNRDWIGVFRAGSNNQQYLDWEYTNGQQTGSVSLTISSPGTYEVRYLKNNGYTVVETSNQIIVADTTGGGGNNGGGTDSGGGTANYSITTSKSQYAINETIDAIWSTPGGNYGALDWIGLYTPGASDRNYIEYEYTDNLSKREQFTISNPGTYEFRYFTANSYNRKAVSATFIVGDTTTGSSCNGFNLSNITNFPSQNPNGPIIALGDSITFGLGASPNQDYVEELEKRLNVNIVNAGVPADTTQDVLNRLNRDVLSREPKTVIVFIGGNDELRRIYEDVRDTAAGRQLRDELDSYVQQELNRNWVNVPLLTRDQTTQNLRTIVQRIQATGANTIIVGFDNNIFNDTIYNSYQTVANQTGSIFIPDIYADIFGRPSRMSDFVHPNDAGYDIVADRIQQGLVCII